MSLREALERQGTWKHHLERNGGSAIHFYRDALLGFLPDQGAALMRSFIIFQMQMPSVVLQLFILPIIILMVWLSWCTNG